jgi:hypothetical protein
MKKKTREGEERGVTTAFGGLYRRYDDGGNGGGVWLGGRGVAVWTGEGVGLTGGPHDTVSGGAGKTWLESIQTDKN